MPLSDEQKEQNRLKVSPQQVIKELVAATGRVGLTAERLGIDREDVLKLITDDQASLAEQFRSAMLVDLYNTFQMVQIVMIEKMDRLSAADVSRMYTALAANFAQLTAKPTEDGKEQPVELRTVQEKFLQKLDDLDERTG